MGVIVPTGLGLFAYLASRFIAVGGVAGGLGALGVVFGYPFFGYRLMTLVARVSRGKVAALCLIYIAFGCLVFWAAGRPETPGVVVLLAIPFSLLALLGLAGLLQSLPKRDPIAIGVATLRAGKLELAMESWEGAAFDAEQRPLLRGLCAELARVQPATALALAYHLCRVAPEEADNWRTRSFLVAQKGDLKGSLVFLEQAMKLSPGQPEDHYNRAVRLSREPESYEDALKEYTTAIGLNGREARYWANRAALYNRMGRHQLALADARKASTLDPEDMVAQTQARIAQGESNESAHGLGLMRVTSKGSQQLIVSGKAEPLFELSHGGDTDQYLEFCPHGRFLASWIPGRIDVFDLESRSSLGHLEANDRGLLGFSPEGDALLTVRDGGVERHALPSLGPAQREQAGQGPGWRLNERITVSTLTGFALSTGSPTGAVAFPYHCRVCPATGATAQPGPHCATLLTGESRWKSPDVGRDVTSVGFSADGGRMVFGTMGGSVYIVDTKGPEVVHQCLADGEIRCLAVSTAGLVAVGCADLSSKTWLFDLRTGQPAHLVDSYGDTWAVAFSADGKTLATGHENGKIRLWKVADLPSPRWA